MKLRWHKLPPEKGEWKFTDIGPWWTFWRDIVKVETYTIQKQPVLEYYDETTKLWLPVEVFEE